MNTTDLEAATRSIAGTARSMGVDVVDDVEPQVTGAPASRSATFPDRIPGVERR